VARKKDFLDELIEVRTRKNPRFPEMLAEATVRRGRQLVLAVTNENRRFPAEPPFIVRAAASASHRPPRGR
jgi:hypothetical protein